MTTCITCKLRHVISTLLREIIRKKSFKVSIMGKIENAFLCTIANGFLAVIKITEISNFRFLRHFWNLAIYKWCNAVTSCTTFKLKHVVCTLRSQILRKKILKTFVMDKFECTPLWTITAFCQSNSLKFHFLFVCFETLPFKNYGTRWPHAWHRSWDMSCAHVERKKMWESRHIG